MNDYLSGLSTDTFLARLSAVLRDEPRGTTAVIDDFCLAWVDGLGVGQIDEEFDLE